VGCLLVMPPQAQLSFCDAGKGFRAKVAAEDNLFL
jgi:hypothetical protein